MNKENVIPVSQEIGKVRQVIRVTNNLLELTKKDRILKLILRQSDFVIEILAREYPLSGINAIVFINKFCKCERRLHSLCTNEKINWIDVFYLIEEDLPGGYESLALAENPNFPWTIEKMKEYIFFLECFTRNTGIIWDRKLLEYFGDEGITFSFYQSEDLGYSEQEFGYIHCPLSRSLSFPFTKEIIKDYELKWDWLALSRNPTLPWSIEFIEYFIRTIDGFIINMWDWDSMSRNEGLPWSLEFLRKFESEWNWRLLASNYSIPWNIKLIRYFINCEKNYLKSNSSKSSFRRALSQNPKIPWTVELIESLHSKGYIYLNWLSGNKGIPWSESLIEKYIEKWDWSLFSRNPNLPWSIGLLEKYKNKWNWNGLSENEGIKWTKNLIQKFDSYLKFGEKDESYRTNYSKGLSGNSAVFFDIKLIKLYEDKWNWNELSKNQGIKWTIDLLEKFEDKWNWDNLPTKAIYQDVFEPYLNNDFVMDILIKLGENEN